MIFFKSKKNLDFSKNKFLFMRHAETIYNSAPEKNFKYNPKYADSHLSQKGITQSLNIQNILNKLNIETIYISPYYRALETMEYALQSHPNAKNIVAYVHPELTELAGMMHEFIFDIKETKNNFNLNSKIKVDWSIFDEYVKNIKYKENLFFMDNWDLIEEKKRDEIYFKFNDLYEKGDMDIYKKEVSKIIEERYKMKLKLESYKHAYQRFIDFKNYINNKYVNSMNDTEKKILVISHKTFISIATSDDNCIFKNNKTSKNCLVLDNCEIAPFSI